jgi:hypothetical protein
MGIPEFAETETMKMTLIARARSYALRESGISGRSAAQRVRGTTLIEMMVVVTLTTLLLGVVITFAFNLRRWDFQTRNHGLHLDQLQRLSESIRGDTGQAVAVSLVGANTLVITNTDKAETLYELVPEGCQRIEKDAAQKLKSRELFTIGTVDSWELERDDSGRRPAAIVTLKPSDPADTKDVLRVPLAVYAVLSDKASKEPGADDSVDGQNEGVEK